MFIKSILEKKSMTNARSTWIEIHFDSLGQRKGSKEGQLASKKDSNSIYFCKATLSKCEQWLFSYSFTLQVWFKTRQDSLTLRP